MAASVAASVALTSHLQTHRDDDLAGVAAEFVSTHRMDRSMGAGCEKGDAACMVDNFVGAMRNLLAAHGLSWAADDPAAEAEAEARRQAEAAKLAQEAADAAARVLREEAAAAAEAKATADNAARVAAAAERADHLEAVKHQESRLAAARAAEREEVVAREAAAKAEGEAAARQAAERETEARAQEEADKEAAIAARLKVGMKRAMREARSAPSAPPKEEAFVKVQQNGGWSFGESTDPYAKGRPDYGDERKLRVPVEEKARRRSVKES